MTEGAVYRFGDVCLDMDRMRLSRAGQPVSVEPKVLDVLRFLIEHRDRLVPKDELLDAIWRDTFVTPNALTRAIAQLRKAIGDVAQEAKYIETAPKRGYRFIASVTIEPHRAAPQVVAPLRAGVPEAASRRRAPAWRVPVLAGAVVVMAVGSVVGWIAVRRSPRIVRPSTSRRLTVQGGSHSWPAVSPDGSLVAYTSDRSGAFEIYVVGSAPGSREIEVTSGGQQNVEPAWSPDGRWIAFHSIARGGVWVIPSTGGAAAEIAETGSQPAWSPDGNWIVFSSSQGAMVGHSTIKIVGRDGTGLRALTQLGGPVGGHVRPVWSSDGRFVVFAVVDTMGKSTLWSVPLPGGSPSPLAMPVVPWCWQVALRADALVFCGGAATTRGLYRLRIDPSTGQVAGAATEIVPVPEGDLDGLSLAADGTLAYSTAAAEGNLWSLSLGSDGTPGDPGAVTDSSVRATWPAYAPDGDRIAFVQAGAGVEWGTWVMKSDGTMAEPLLTEGLSFNPMWNREGTRLLVQRVLDGQTTTLWWIDVATRRATQVPAVGIAAMRDPRLSPDGTRLVYWTTEPNGAMNVWWRPADGSGAATRLTSDAQAVTFPAWSPDGRWLAVEIKRGETTQVGVLSRDGGPVEPLTDATGQSWPHSWSPDGEHIAFAGERGGVWNAWEVSRRTRVSRQLTSFSSPSGYVRYPAWSPRGNRIVFERETRHSSVWLTQVP